MSNVTSFDESKQKKNAFSILTSKRSNEKPDRRLQLKVFNRKARVCTRTHSHEFYLAYGPFGVNRANLDASTTSGSIEPFFSFLRDQSPTLSRRLTSPLRIVIERAPLHTAIRSTHKSTLSCGTLRTKPILSLLSFSL